MKIITHIYRRLEILPHFLAHYSALGVDGFYFVINERGGDGDIIERFRTMSEGYPVVIADVYDEVYNDRNFRSKLRDIQAAHMAPHEWYVSADLDEFTEFPMPLDRLTETCERLRYDYVMGEFMDRVAADGSLPLLGTNSIWEQFPVQLRLTRDLMGGVPYKAIMQRGPLQLWVHQPERGRMFPSLGVIHHFKWHGALIERMEERVRLCKDHQLDWWVESQRFLDHFHAFGRIDIERIRDIEQRKRLESTAKRLVWRTKRMIKGWIDP